MPIKLGEEIKKIREEKGICAKRLAYEVGISLETLSAYERGYSEPWRKLEIIFKKLGYELDVHKVE